MLMVFTREKQPAGGRRGLFSRLFGWLRRKPAAGAETKPDEVDVAADAPIEYPKAAE